MRSACDEAPMSSVSSFLPAHAAHPSANLALHEVLPTGCSRLLRVLCSLVTNHMFCCVGAILSERGLMPLSRPPSPQVTKVAAQHRRPHTQSRT